MSNIFWIFIDGGANITDPEDTFGANAYMITQELEGGFHFVESSAEYKEGTTTPVMELTAALRALKFIQVQKVEKCDIYIVADALNTVKSYEEWYYGWRRRAKNGVWKNAENKTVLNQEVIKETVSIIEDLKKNNYVKFFHINSHSTKHTIEQFHQNFMKNNKVTISLELFKVLLKFNDMVDKLCTKTRLEGRSNYGKKKLH